MPATFQAPADADQQTLLRLADRSADAVDVAVRRAWADLLAAAGAGGPWFAVHARVAAALRQLHLLPAVLADDLRRSGLEAHRFVAGRVAGTLPPAARDRLLRRRGLVEADDEEPVLALADLLLPNPEREEIDAAVFSGGWLARLGQFSRLPEPEALAAVIASGVQRGRTGAQLVRDVRPLVEGLRVAARRVARDAGLWVAHEIELRAYERLGPEVVTGYTVHAVPRTRYSRPEHLKRSGTTYWRAPKGSQLGFDRMPRPPFEADGTLAYGCRCYLSPVIDAG